MDKNIKIKIMEFATKQGLIAILFCWVLFSTSQRTDQREKNYQVVIEKNQNIILENQAVISELSKKFTIIEEVREDIKEIKLYVNQRR